MFVTIEGIEGSGKTTHVSLLAEALEALGYRVRITREPGGTPAGEEIRRILLHQGSPLTPRAELFLILAARAEHVARVIRPALERGEIVLCDRFGESTLAYQAYGRGLPVDEVTRLEEASRNSVTPDVTFVLDCPTATGLARTRRRRGPETTPDRFESEEVAFHDRVRAGFRALAKRAPERVLLIDSERPRENVHRTILEDVQRRLETTRPGRAHGPAR